VFQDLVIVWDGLGVDGGLLGGFSGGSGGSGGSGVDSGCQTADCVDVGDLGEVLVGSDLGLK